MRRRPSTSPERHVRNIERCDKIMDLEDRLRKRVEDCRMFLKVTKAFPPRNAALAAYAAAVQELHDFLSSVE
jgi:hypothetical protein